MSDVSGKRQRSSSGKPFFRELVDPEIIGGGISRDRITEIWLRRRMVYYERDSVKPLFKTLLDPGFIGCVTTGERLMTLVLPEKQRWC